MTCSLEFFPPSEAYWAASGIPLAGRVARLRADWPAEPPGALPAPTPSCPAAVSLPGSASPIEKTFWEAHRRLALPELDGLIFQHRVGKFRLDFALPDRMIGIELDGFRNHSKTEDVARDHLRQRWLGGLRWYVIRFGGSDVHHDAESCVKQAAFLTGVWGEDA
jgi:very-short-patch-repair endonuclease